MPHNIQRSRLSLPCTHPLSEDGLQDVPEPRVYSQCHTAPSIRSSMLFSLTHTHFHGFEVAPTLRPVYSYTTTLQSVCQTPKRLRVWLWGEPSQHHLLVPISEDYTVSVSWTSLSDAELTELLFFRITALGRATTPIPFPPHPTSTSTFLPRPHPFCFLPLALLPTAYSSRSHATVFAGGALGEDYLMFSTPSTSLLLPLAGIRAYVYSDTRSDSPKRRLNLLPGHPELDNHCHVAAS